MKKKYIIKNKREIDSLFKNSIKKGDPYFSIFLKDDGTNVNFRFSLSIGKKFGNAVTRNKIKRQLRSIVRENKDLIKKSSNFVIVIKKIANTLSYEEINNKIVNLLIKLNIMEKNRWKITKKS